VMASPTNASFVSREEPPLTGKPSISGWAEVLFPHEGIRFLMQEFCEAVHAMDPLPAWKWQNLSVWYQEYFYDVVHHYDTEEQIYLPWIQAHVMFACVPSKMTADHHHLMQTMDDLRDMIKDGLAMPVGDRAEHLAQLRKRVLAFVQGMHEHLAEEERVIPSILRDARFTKSDEDAAVGKIIASLELDGNERALPTMVRALESARPQWSIPSPQRKRAGSQQAKTLVSEQLPLSSNLFDFQQRHLGLLASLREGIETDPFA